MGEIASAAESTSSNSVSTCSTTEGSTGQVGTEGRSERGAGREPADIRGDTSCLVSTDILTLQACLDGRDEGTSCASREVAAAGLTDGRGAVDGLTTDTGICWLVSQGGMLSWFR